MVKTAWWRAPSVERIRDLEGSNGLIAASTFSGGGGSATGLRWAGFRVLYSSEFMPDARETYLANYPDAHVDPRDIREVTAADILERFGGREVDLLEGSPPCASFSTCGTRDKKWGEVKSYSKGSQRTDDLFLEFARVLEGVRPRAFWAENVMGLVKGKARGYFVEILEVLRKAGYKVEARALDASWLGVPQRRERVIFSGIREDVKGNPPFPKPERERVTLREALEGIEVSREEAERLSIARYAIGDYWKATPYGGNHEKCFNLARPHWNRPAPTLTQLAGNLGAASLCHPDIPRKFSTAELRRICGFPDDYKLTGTYTDRVERLGRSVPPPMAYRMALAFAEVL